MITQALRTRLRALVGDLAMPDAQVDIALERHPRLDVHGQPPFLFEPGSPPVAVPNPDWTPTYDLHAAAADLLEEKAALLIKDFDFATENERFERSQKYHQALTLIRYHRARRTPQTQSLTVWPANESPLPVGNAPEPLD